eukprot:COSAG05_NODE_2363_length_3174_cov_2.055935_3_plen_681_part_00
MLHTSTAVCARACARRGCALLWACGMGDDTPTASSIAEALAGAGSSSSALDQLEAAALGGGDDAVAVGLTCAPSLATMLCDDIPVADFQRGALILGALCRLDRAVMARVNPFAPMLRATVAGFAVWRNQQDLAARTLEDVYTLICAACCLPPWWSFGVTSILAQDGCLFESEQDVMGGETAFVAVYGEPNQWSEEAVTRFFLLLLELLRDKPEMRPRQHLDVFEASAWYWICAMSIGRKGPSQALVRAGLMEFGVDQLDSRWSPIERVGLVHQTPGALLSALKDVFENSEEPGRSEMLQHALDTGVIEMVICNIRTYEVLGRSATKLGSVMGNWYACWWFLTAVDMQAKAAEPVVTMLREVASAVRFALDHPLVQMAQLGFTTSCQGTMVAAEVFGRDEDRLFTFTQHDVDSVLLVSREQVRPQAWGAVWPLRQNQSQALLSLTVSDLNKQLLLYNPEFLPHLVDGLLLAPRADDEADANEYEHDVITARGWHPDNDRTVIPPLVQRTFAECLQQLSLWEPGRRAMLADPSVASALRALTTRAWTPEAKLCAHGALLALMDHDDHHRRHQHQHQHHHHQQQQLQPRNSGSSPASKLDSGGDGGGGGGGGLHHVMLSYEWTYQELVKRVVLQLQSRGYRVWFDLECMKGSTIDVRPPSPLSLSALASALLGFAELRVCVHV